MRLIAPFIDMAERAGLKNSIPDNGQDSTFAANVGNYGLVISELDVSVECVETRAHVSLGFGLDEAHAPDEIQSLIVRYDGEIGDWLLEYELHGEDPPPEIRSIAERFGLKDLEGAVMLVDGQEREVVQAFVDFLAGHRRSDPRMSTIPVAEFVRRGGRPDR